MRTTPFHPVNFRLILIYVSLYPVVLKVLFSFRFPITTLQTFLNLACHSSRQSYPVWLYHPSNICWGEQSRNTSLCSLMFVLYKLDVVEMTNNMHWLYHSFIYILVSTCFGSSLLLRSFWVTWNTNRMGGISCNLWLRSLCGGMSWLRH
jgi:hypothetical protein